MRSLDELAIIASIADALPCGVWVAAAPDGRFVYSNDAFEEIMGMGPVTDVGVGAYTVPYGIYGRNGELYPEHRLPFVRALTERTTVVVDDLVIHRRDGRRVYVRAIGKPMVDTSGVITHVAIAFFDISREAEAEEARSQAEERLRSVVGNAPVVLFALDREAKITFVDGRGLSRLGLQPADFLGKSAFEAYANASTAASWIQRALAGETVSYLAELPPDAMYETHLAPLRDEAGAIVGAIGVSTDVTDRHRIQAQLAQAERLASVGLLAAGVAHEVNNPLSFVIGNLELISSAITERLGAPRDAALEVLEGMVRDARKGADRVRAIVRDLKTFSQVREQRPGPLDVQAPLEAAIAMASNEIRHRARLRLDLTRLPLVRGEEGRLAQVFLNLLVNAAHSIAEGAADKNEIHVTVRPDPRGGARIEVSDTGAGMEPAHLARVFDPFFTTKGPGGGTGLGLSICHGVVADLGGSIGVESAPGQGTTVRVFLPYASETTTPEPAPLASEVSATRVTPRRRSVLIIDDEPLILKLVASVLATEHDVTCEARAELALARIRGGERFDAIVCDLMMPQVTGMDLHEALLEIAPRQAEAMLFLTGGAFTPRARAFLDRIANPTIEKPFDSAALKKGLERLVG
jgi:two-component system cell cycle sensor histidine kinase/response regulator CckA